MKALVAMVLFSGCVASTNSALVSQTKSAKGWFCKDEPIVDCRGGCSAQSNEWRAYCGNKKYLCRFNEEHVGEAVFRSASCRADQ